MPADDLEVEHLGREDERRRHAHQRARRARRACWLVRRTATASTAIVTTHMTAAIGTDRKPSGACIWGGVGDRAGAGQDDRGKHRVSPGRCSVDVDGSRQPVLLQRACNRRYPRRYTSRDDRSPGSLVETGRTAGRPRPRCAPAGLRWTPQRRLLLEVLARTDGHVTGSELVERCRAVDPATTPSTVYRTLDVLEELGIVRHTHGPTAARSSTSGRGPTTGTCTAIAAARAGRSTRPMRGRRSMSFRERLGLRGRPQPPDGGRPLRGLPGRGPRLDHAAATASGSSAPRSRS